MAKLQDIGHTEEAFGAMVRRNEALIYKVSLAFATQYGSTAEDLRQEMLCDLWRGFEGFRHQCAESTWIYRVVLNTALMRQRKERRGPELVSLEGNGVGHEPTTVLDEAERAQLEHLYALIARLETEEQKLIYLYLDGLSGKEMAEVMEMREGAVKVRLHRIKVKLKKMAEHEQE